VRPDDHVSKVYQIGTTTYPTNAMNIFVATVVLGKGEIEVDDMHNIAFPVVSEVQRFGAEFTHERPSHEQKLQWQRGWETRQP
jgi:hypothetical protein